MGRFAKYAGPVYCLRCHGISNLDVAFYYGMCEDESHAFEYKIGDQIRWCGRTTPSSEGYSTEAVDSGRAVRGHAWVFGYLMGEQETGQRPSWCPHCSPAQRPNVGFVSTGIVLEICDGAIRSVLWLDDSDALWQQAIPGENVGLDEPGHDDA